MIGCGPFPAKGAEPTTARLVSQNSQNVEYRMVAPEPAFGVGVTTAVVVLAMTSDLRRFAWAESANITAFEAQPIASPHNAPEKARLPIVERSGKRGRAASGRAARSRAARSSAASGAGTGGGCGRRR